MVFINTARLPNVFDAAEHLLKVWDRSGPTNVRALSEEIENLRKSVDAVHFQPKESPFDLEEGDVVLLGSGKTEYVVEELKIEPTLARMASRLFRLRALSENGRYTREAEIQVTTVNCENYSNFEFKHVRTMKKVTSFV